MDTYIRRYIDTDTHNSLLQHTQTILTLPSGIHTHIYTYTDAYIHNNTHIYTYKDGYIHNTHTHITAYRSIHEQS